MKQITYSINAGTFALVDSPAIAHAMIACGNPYGHNRGCAATPANLKMLQNAGLKQIKYEPSLDSCLAEMEENEVWTTREFAAALGISTREAYKLLSAAEQAEKVCKYGYRVKGGWDDPAHTNRKCDSLGWQVIK